MNRFCLLWFNLILLFLIQSQSWASNEDPSQATTGTQQTSTGKRKRTSAPKLTGEEKRAKKARREAARARQKQLNENLRNQSNPQLPIQKSPEGLSSEHRPEFHATEEVNESVQAQNLDEKELKKKRHREYMREYSRRPEIKERQRERMREYSQRPEIKERMREYKQRPEVKERMRERMREHMREYNQRPEVKERMREYSQRPEVKERQRERMREYKQRPEVKKRLREYSQRPEVKERRRARYAEDLESRERKLARARERYYEKKEKLLRQDEVELAKLQQNIESIQTTAALSGEQAESRPGNYLIKAFEEALEIEQDKAPMTPAAKFAAEVLANLVKSHELDPKTPMGQALGEIFEFVDEQDGITYD